MSQLKMLRISLSKLESPNYFISGTTIYIYHFILLLAVPLSALNRKYH